VTLSSTPEHPITRVAPAGDRWLEWDAFVEATAGSTFCHRSSWHRIMRDVMRQEPDYLVAEDDSGWRGVLPLVHVRGLLGHYLVSMPFLDDGGPLGDRVAQEALTAAAVEIAKKTGAKLLELRSRSEVFGPLTTNSRKVSVQLELPSSVEDLWSKTFKAKLRSQVRRPAKEGMVAKSGADQLDAFYRIFCRNMRDLGTPVLPYRFFEEQRASFGDSVVFTGVYSADGKATAASCSFVWREEMYVIWASSLREYNRLSPNMLLYSAMMEEAIRRGLSRFNFGRSTPGASTHRFKQQWGGNDVPLPWAYWSPHAASSTPTPDKPLFRVATAVWSRLPVPIANGVGPMLARQLP
jgi:serine/alanine adding enzyme